MFELFRLALSAMLAFLVIASVVELLRSYRELYDDFGATRYVVHQQVRKQVVVLALRMLLLIVVLASDCDPL